MPVRHILVVDEDRGFLDLLRAALAPYGVTIDAATGADDCLDKVAGQRHELALIAVDLPEKSGFSLFSRLRGLSKTLPVALVTSTVPPTEMSLHQKLKNHADAYWDKRGLTAADLRAKVGKLVELPPIEESLPEAPDLVEEALDQLDEMALGDEALLREEEPAPAPDLDANASAFAPAQLEALIADPRGAPVGRGLGAPPPVLDAQAIAALRQEIDEVRRLARTSPFSRDFSRMVERLDEKDGELLALHGRLEASERALQDAHELTRRLAQQALGASRGDEGLRQKLRSAEEAAVAADEGAQRARQSADAVRQAHEVELQRLAAELEREQQEHADTRLQLEAADDAQRGYQQQTAALQAEFEAEIEELRAQHEKQLAALTARHEEHRRRAEQTAQETLRAHLQDEQQQALAALREQLAAEHASHVAELEARYAETLQRKDEEQLTALRRASHELTAVRTELLGRLDEAHRQHEAQRAALAAHKADEARRISDAKAAVRRELEGAWREQQARALEALRAEFAAEREREIAGLKAQHEQDLKRLASEHTAVLRRAAEGLAAERDEARLRLNQAREQFETQLATLTATQAAALQQEQESKALSLRELQAQFERDKRREAEAWRDEARREMERQLAALKATQQEILEKKEVEHLASLRRASEELAALKSEMLARLDEARERHESQILSLKSAQAGELRRVEDAKATALQELRVRLEDGQRAALEDARREQQQKVLRLEAALRQSELDVAAARDVAQSAISTSRQELEAELKALKARHAEELRRATDERSAVSANAEKRLEHEKAQATLAVTVEWENKLKLAQREHAEASAALQQRHEQALATLRQQHEQALAAAHAEHKRQQEELERKAESQAFEQREAALAAQEALMIEQKEQALTALEARWQTKLEQTRQELASGLRKEQEQSLAGLTAEHERALQQKDVQNKNFALRLAKLEQELQKAAAAVAERDRVIEGQKRELADRAQTIVSLNAMIGDFSGQTVAASAAKESGQPSKKKAS